MIALFINTFVKIFFLLTPFFVISMFLSMTQQLETSARHKIAVRTTLAIIVTAFILFFFGNYLFDALGITLSSFEIGAGALLFLSAVSLVHGGKAPAVSENEDIAVVPLALPLTVGPGTTGALLVLGAQITEPGAKFVASIGVLLAIVAVGALLYAASSIERIVGAKGITVLSKLTGLVLAALAAQLVFTGIGSFGHS